MTSNESATPIADPLDRLLAYQLRRVSALVIAELAASLSEIGLRVTEASVLVMIDANPDVTQSEIGRCLGIKRANMAPLASGLELRRLIERSPVDGRSQALRVTAKGKDLVARINQLTAANEARFFGDIPEDERRALIDRLKLIRSRAGD